jgi:hypothetical protein
METCLRSGHQDMNFFGDSIIMTESIIEKDWKNGKNVVPQRL